MRGCCLGFFFSYCDFSKVVFTTMHVLREISRWHELLLVYFREIETSSGALHFGNVHDRGSDTRWLRHRKRCNFFVPRGPRCSRSVEREVRLERQEACRVQLKKDPRRTSWLRMFCRFNCLMQWVSDRPPGTRRQYARWTVPTTLPNAETPHSHEYEAIEEYLSKVPLAEEWSLQGARWLPTGWAVSDESEGVFGELFDLADRVARHGACSLPGVNIKFDNFMACMWRAVSRGFVRRASASLFSRGCERDSLRACQLHFEGSACLSQLRFFGGRSSGQGGRSDGGEGGVREDHHVREVG